MEPQASQTTRLATIGVYGFTAQTFLDALRRADVRVLPGWKPRTASR